MDCISMEDRNALLVILGLLLTATFQASLSPPGSVIQGEVSSNFTRDPDSYEMHQRMRIPGKSVMGETDFLLFYIPTCLVFIVTFFLTLGLLNPFPAGFRTALQILLAFLAISFFESIQFLSPTKLAGTVISSFSISILFIMTFMCISYRVSRFSVLVLGTWLSYGGDPVYVTFVEFLMLKIVIVCWLLLFLYDEFWRGIAVGVGFIILSYSEVWFTYKMPTEWSLVLGFWFFLFLHDKFWKGSFAVLGFCAVFGFQLDQLTYSLRDAVDISYLIYFLGSWLFLSLCRFCIIRCIGRCRVIPR